MNAASTTRNTRGTLPLMFSEVPLQFKLLGVAIMVLPQVALANDSVAELGAGGLQMVHADQIAMTTEDLFISLQKVDVNYVFTNTGDQDLTVTVAFPMPVLDPDLYLNEDTSLPKPGEDNVLDFHVAVEGTPVETKLETRATSGVLDITDELKTLNIPLNPMADQTRKAVAALPAEKLGNLVSEGAVIMDGDTYEPAWTLKSAYYWNQTFPAHKPLRVSHSYVPAVGATFYSGGEEQAASNKKRFCIDEGTRQAMDAVAAAAKAKNFLAEERHIQYVLSTGSNWAGGIGKFHLTIDKGAPDNIISLCLDGIQKTAPTKFEVFKTDFSPDKDLDILIVAPFRE